MQRKAICIISAIFIAFFFIIEALPAIAGVTVYVTKTGKKYHASGCRNLAKGSIPIDLSKAKEQGYTPCQNCNPTSQSQTSATPTKPASSQTKTASADTDLQINGLYYVRVVRVVDGDTIEVAFSDTHKEKVRLIGVDTPETVHPSKPVQQYGKEASDFTKKSLTDKKVYLQLGVGMRDRYQRLLGYVWMEKPNDVSSEQEIRTKMFNAKLLLEGYCQVMTIQPNSQYADIFSKFQGEARKSQKGLWRDD